jgi:hypothetical protein
VVGAGVSTTVLERVRVQLMFNYYPAPHAQEVGWWAVGPGIGVQFPF